jgi:hypothetical protein
LVVRYHWLILQIDEAEMIKHFGLDYYAHSTHTKKPIKSKYAFRVTVNIDGDLKYRGSLVGCGYSQIFGQDYDETFAPTAKYRSLCILLHLAAVFDWEISGLDVEQAFLESNIDTEIYMNLPIDVYEDSITHNPETTRLRLK